MNTKILSSKVDDKESKEPDYDEDKDKLEEKQKRISQALMWIPCKAAYMCWHEQTGMDQKELP